jgi:DNA topoisomerase-1
MTSIQHRTASSLSVDTEIAAPVAAAREAGLRYVSDARPGIRRKRAGKHFSYIGLDSNPIHDQKELERIHHIGIPPAWKDVWICPDPRGHIQATGRDAKGRKQYRYHPEWREIRDETKYDRMQAFGQALPTLRQRVEQDLGRSGLIREKVLAAIVRLLDTTSIRVGNEEYARENASYGLTTLHTDHVEVKGSELRFHFRGKGGKVQEIDIRDRRLARLVKRCQDLPGQELFQYEDENGALRTVGSDDVNEYLREATGQEFSAKDFRTWAGTVTAVCALQDLGPVEKITDAKKNVVHAIEIAAHHLGNTPAICRKSYVHPEVIAAYLDGWLLTAIQQHNQKQGEGLKPEEAAVLAFLEK